MGKKMAPQAPGGKALSPYEGSRRGYAGVLGKGGVEPPVGKKKG